MSDDPFATDTPAADPWSESTPNPAPEAPVSQTDLEVSATLKAGTGFDAPWLVARGPNAAAVVAEMRTWFGDGGLIDATAKTADAFRKATGNDKPAAAPAASRQPSTPPPGGSGKTCQHGEMTFRTGTNAKGQWKGYFCPTPQGTPDQCKPTFVR